jgi:hypothetical protein
MREATQGREEPHWIIYAYYEGSYKV